MASPWEKRSSAKCISPSCPRTRSRSTGRDGVRRLEATTCSHCGRCCTNMAMDSDVVPWPSSTWRSSSTSTRGPKWRRSSSSSSPATASISAPRRWNLAVPRAAQPGANPSRAASTPSHSWAGSRSVSSRESQACCNEVSETQLRSSEVFPEPAGAVTSVSGPLTDSSSRACRRGRTRRCSGLGEGRSFACSTGASAAVCETRIAGTATSSPSSRSITAAPGRELQGERHRHANSSGSKSRSTLRHVICSVTRQRAPQHTRTG